MAYLLRNRVYLGEINHRMTPTYAVKKGMRYSYYISSTLAQGRREEAGSVSRIPAAEIETLVLTALRANHPDPQISDRDLVETAERITIRSDRIAIALHGTEDPIVLPWSATPFRRRRELIQPTGAEPQHQLKPMKNEDRTRILKGIAKARIWMGELSIGVIADADALASREGCDERSMRRTLSLASLSPKIVQAIIAGQFPRGIGLRDLSQQPVAWSEQHASLGF